MNNFLFNMKKHLKAIIVLLILGLGCLTFSLLNAIIPGKPSSDVLATFEEEAAKKLDEEIEDQMFNKKEGFDPTNGAEEQFDTLMKDCLRYFIKAKKASASSLQGYFGIGYPKANKIVLQMEKAGFVSAGDNNGRRTLFITQQEFEERFGEDLDE